MRKITVTVDDVSLSARRAWIEIIFFRATRLPVLVALRKESVDRNLYYGDGLTFADGSLSARRAWIEIKLFNYSRRFSACRSPQGERG